MLFFSEKDSKKSLKLNLSDCDTLIKESIPNNTSFGDAIISDKHANFFINKKNAKFNDMKSLIDFVKKKVKIKTGIDLTLEIVIVE